MSTFNTIDYGISPGHLIWEQGFQASRDDKNQWTGSEAFQCLKSEVTKLIPKKGAACQYPGFSFMTAVEVDVENLPGGYDRIKVKYSGVGQTGDFTFEPNDKDADPEFDKYTYDLSIVTSNDPIETHPKFRNISAKDREIIYNIIKGNLKRSDKMSSGELAEPYTFYRVDEDNGKKYTLTSDENAHKLADYLINGVTTYQRARQQWTCSFTSPALPGANILNFVGYITSAKGAPPVADGRNWLFQGITTSMANGMCNISYTWQLSETGGWDSFIYTKP